MSLSPSFSRFPTEVGAICSLHKVTYVGVRFLLEIVHWEGPGFRPRLSEVSYSLQSTVFR